MNKLDRDIRNLIQILLRNKVPVIYPAEIAQLLHCEARRVENVLLLMTEEGILGHRYEMHCGYCGEVMAIFEDPRFLTCAHFPCDACYTQMGSMAMNPTVSAYYPQGKVRVLEY